MASSNDGLQAASLRAVKTGDMAAIREVVGRFQPAVYNFLLKLCADRALAEDLSQDTFVRFVRNVRTIENPAGLRTWLYRVARNLYLDHLRKGRLRKHASLDHGADATSPPLSERLPARQATPEQALLLAGLRAQLVRSLNALPVAQREVFLLRHQEKLSFEQIASITETSENTVKSRMRYALLRLRSLMSAEVAEPPTDSAGAEVQE